MNVTSMKCTGVHSDAITFPDRLGVYVPMDTCWRLTVVTVKVFRQLCQILIHCIQYFIIDVDECQTPANNCKFQCKNLIGTFMCICPPGYTQIGHIDDCEDINECITTPNVCANGNCVNLQGSYRCDCYDGFEPSRDYTECIGKLCTAAELQLVTD